ncbi:aldehyde dehydrogenase [Ramaria rubella]|nr:aldehyde dehydrogenase [Ramaria rubella]
MHPCATASLSDIPVVNPADGEQLADVKSTSPAEVDHAIRNAQKVFEEGAWSKSLANHRSSVMSRLARSLESRIDELAILESLQTDYYAALVRTHQAFVAPTQGHLLNYVKRLPLDFDNSSQPFNHPLLIAVKKIAPALAMGNSIILKPSEVFPPNVLQVLPGLGNVTGLKIISNPIIKKVDVTAGTKAGREIGSIVGSNLGSFTAELGGKAPIVVFEDADLKSAINGVAFAAFVASGQTCVSGTRLIIQEKIYDAFMCGFLEKIRGITLRIGSPMNPLSSMGSVISSLALSRISTMVSSRSSGTILAGGEKMTGFSSLDGYDLSKGSFYPPTVIEDVATEDDLWQEEIFGPVVVVKRFKDDEEGIRLANLSRYALGAGIWTTNLSRAHRVASEIEAGLVWINCHHRNDPSSPWGGMKESGIGRENGIEALEQCHKSIIVNCASADEIRQKEDWFAEDTQVQKRYG